MKNKGYEKALNLFNQGNIEKAIEVCEREISRDLSNSNIINLKALLLYLKGELEDSIALWNINRDYNNDKIVNSYLKDIKNDFNRKELYHKAESLIQSLYIDEAIEVLKECEESDFNLINVKNALAICHLKKGNYENSNIYVKEVLKIDKYNSRAKQTVNEIENIFSNNKNKVNKKIILTIPIIIIIIGIAFINREKILNYKVDNKTIIKNINNIEEKNLEELDNNYIENNTKEVISENAVINKKVLSDEEIRENYIQATENYEKENFEEAKEILENTISYLKGSHLDDDIIFLLASTCEKLQDIDKAIENFDNYIINYPNGSYIQEVYYRAALLYKNTNIDKSKSYANEILINYYNSIYNNSYVQEIINL